MTKIIRIADELHDALRARAELEGRTISMQASIYIGHGMNRQIEGEDIPRGPAFTYNSEKPKEGWVKEPAIPLQDKINKGPSLTPEQFAKLGVTKGAANLIKEMKSYKYTPKEMEIGVDFGREETPVDMSLNFPLNPPTITGKPCCANRTKPCQHWQWDTATGEGYRNILTGEYLEVN